METQKRKLIVELFKNNISAKNIFTPSFKSSRLNSKIGLAECIISILTNRRIHRTNNGDRASKHEKRSYRNVILPSIEKGEPIELVYFTGPYKNRLLLDPKSLSLNAQSQVKLKNKVNYAEFFAFSRVARIVNTIKKIYAPGANVKVLFDNKRIQKANLLPSNYCTSYINSIIKMTKTFKFNMSFLDSDSIYEELKIEDKKREAALEFDHFAKTNPEGLQLLYHNASENLPKGASVNDIKNAARSYWINRRAEGIAGMYPFMDYSSAQPQLKSAKFFKAKNALFIINPGGYRGVLRTRSAGNGVILKPWQSIGGIRFSNNKFGPCFITKNDQSKILVKKFMDLKNELPKLAAMFGPLPVFDTIH